MAKSRHDFGGPAFPGRDTNGKVTWPYPGMLLADYLVAHAPPRPSWFIPSMGPEPPVPWGQPGEEGMKERYDEWLSEKERQKDVQWPYYWALQQIRERNRLLAETAEEPEPRRSDGREWECTVCGARLDEPRQPHRTPKGASCSNALMHHVPAGKGG